MTRNINAPLPGTYDPTDPTSGLRPLGNIGNLYQYESSGILRQNQVIANFNIRGGRKFTLFSTYTFNYARGNTRRGRVLSPQSVRLEHELRTHGVRRPPSGIPRGNTYHASRCKTELIHRYELGFAI